MESNAVNGLIVPKRKMINAFNLFSAIYSRKHLFGKNLSVLMYSRLECLLSEPEHLPLLLGWDVCSPLFTCSCWSFFLPYFALPLFTCSHATSLSQTSLNAPLAHKLFPDAPLDRQPLSLLFLAPLVTPKDFHPCHSFWNQSPLLLLDSAVCILLFLKSPGPAQNPSPWELVKKKKRCRGMKQWMNTLALITGTQCEDLSPCATLPSKVYFLYTQ